MSASHSIIVNDVGDMKADRIGVISFNTRLIICNAKYSDANSPIPCGCI